MTLLRKYLGFTFAFLLISASSSWALFGPSEEEIAKDARSRSMMPIFEGQQAVSGSIRSLPKVSGDFIQAQDEIDGSKTRFWRGFSAGKYLGFSELASREPVCYLSLTAPTNKALDQIASNGINNIRISEARRVDKKIKTYSAFEWAKMYFKDHQKYKAQVSSPIEPYVNGAYQSRVTMDFIAPGNVRGTIQCEAHTEDEHPITWGHFMRGFGSFLQFNVNEQPEKRIFQEYTRTKKQLAPLDVADGAVDAEIPRSRGVH